VTNAADAVTGTIQAIRTVGNGSRIGRLGTMMIGLVGTSMLFTSNSKSVVMVQHVLVVRIPVFLFVLVLMLLVMLVMVYVIVFLLMLFLVCVRIIFVIEFTLIKIQSDAFDEIFY
jgi:hypothetical protein